MTKEIVGSGWSFPPQIGPQGNLLLTSERNELEQAIHIILRTVPGQRVMRPRFGCRIHELLFAPNNAQTARLAERYVEEALGMWEPRIIVMEVTAQPIENRLLLEIKYKVKATNDPRSLVFPFYLIPEE
ncbi:MAG: GPW/gp25 family protein [Chloroflexota bacterium]|nr:GPW/gp25 family protein [Anaerolineales bacterium]MCB8968570.1 GPW/gp25 family protein [Ardenticatenaceae bacterium]